MRRAGVLGLAMALLALGGCRQPLRLDGGATRPIEARLGAADRWRRLQPGPWTLPLASQATLERQGAWQALGDVALMAGRLDAARTALTRAPPSPSLQNDRAALALASGDLEGALEVLADLPGPGSGAARWNRALALRELGLWRSAAAAFDEVAALGEPGWADEARADAATLRRRVAERDGQWRAVTAAGKSMVATGALPPASMRASHPSYLRHYFYHALRAAPSLARVRALAPLAAELDARDGGHVLDALLARTAARDVSRRAPLAATYARLVANPAALDRVAADAYLTSLRRAGEDDLLLGALLLLNRQQAQSQEFARLAAATGDPWYRYFAADVEATRLMEHDRLVDAESLLVPALADCRLHRLDYRCVYLESALTEDYNFLLRSDDAQRLGRQALVDARAHALSREFELLRALSETARHRFRFALMDAYLGESVLSRPDLCDAARWAWERSANARLMKLDLAGARAALDRAPRCEQPITLLRAYALTALSRQGLGGAEAATLPADLAVARAQLPLGRRAQADVLQARLVIGRDRPAGERMLTQALAEAAQAPDDVDAKRARAYAYLTRAVEAALAGDDAAALTALAADAGTTPPQRCALGIAIDEERIVTVLRGADGRMGSQIDRHRTSLALDPERLAPPPLRARLAGCQEIQVFAPPPVHGLPRLLPPELAWSYRVHPPSTKRWERLPARRLVVANPTPPPSLSLPRLADWRLPDSEGATVLEGAAATPARVLAELPQATEVEVHAHGLVDLGLSDASVLALSPDGNGRFALSARDLLALELRGHPVVILGACRAAQDAGYLHEPWGLPLAFVTAGARAVFASPAPIGDAEAGPFFAAVLARLHAGASPAVALRDERLLALSRDSHSWVGQLLVFE